MDIWTDRDTNTKDEGDGRVKMLATIEATVAAAAAVVNEGHRCSVTELIWPTHNHASSLPHSRH